MVTLTVTLGLPASGKTTWAQTQPGYQATTDPARHGRLHHDQLVHSLQAEARRQLAAGNDVITDGCNLSARLRRSWLQVGRDHDARCVLAIVECDPDEAVRRNLERPHGERVLPHRMDGYVRRLPEARTMVGGEGWDAIAYPLSTHVRLQGATRSW